MSIRRSQWITDQNPSLPGVYERFTHGTYARWTGARWCSSRQSILAASLAFDASPVQRVNAPWRGLAEAPK